MRVKANKISKDWLFQKPQRKPVVPMVVQLAVEDVVKMSDIPDLVSVEEAARKLEVSEYTCAEYMRTNKLLNVKIGRGRFTTARWIALYLQSLMHGKNG